MKQNQAINSSDTNPFTAADTPIDSEMTKGEPLINFFKVTNPALLYLYMALEFIFIYWIPAPKTILGIILCAGVLIFQVVCIREYIKIFNDLEHGIVRTNFTKYVIFVVEGRLSNIILPALALIMFYERTRYLELIYLFYLVGVLITHFVAAKILKKTLKFMLKHRLSLKSLSTLVLILPGVLGLIRILAPKNSSSGFLSENEKIIFLFFSTIIWGALKWVINIMTLSLGHKKVHRYVKLIILFFPEYYRDLETAWNATIQKVE